MPPPERPIIFSGPMVRALLAGRKTMTRRLVTSPLRKCEPGDLLWVREGFTAYEKQELLPDKRFFRRVPTVLYAADFEGFNKPDRDWNWSASIHMPRWACRITLRVTGVKIERLQDITNTEAVAEGALESGLPYTGAMTCDDARVAFSLLWDSLHGKLSWEQNPEVVAVSFVREGIGPMPPPETPRQLAGRGGYG